MNESSGIQQGEGQPTREDDRSVVSQELTVVGIGGSAGALGALQAFFDAMPTDTSMAFVVVTHMAPDRESLLPEILQQHTKMRLHQVTELVAVEPNHVYVIPPNRRMIMTDTHLDVQAFEAPYGQRAPIDIFFRSLAAVHPNAVAIILSGEGTDGAVGMKDVKEQGGLIMVQDPDEAAHDSMPRAAIATGLADVILPARQLVDALVTYHRNRNRVQLSASQADLSNQEWASLHHVLNEVYTQTGHDFSLYKHTTILRRIQRRMQLRGLGTLAAYLGYLQDTPDEALALFNDLLIGVTNFFRDKEAWNAAAEQVIPRLFAGKEPGDMVRVWSLGCATGEEAYSAAILLLEHAVALRNATRLDEISSLTEASALGPIKLQVFASDLDAIALAKARQGLYPAAIEVDVSAARLTRFFTREGSYYRVRRELRDIVLFSEHSVLRDPPFSRLDFISCRNLLIYLNRELQEIVLNIFYYALNPGGYLFLGSAESAERVGALFHPVDKDHHLYQARPWQGKHPYVPSLPFIMRNPRSFETWPAGQAHERASTGPAPDAAAVETQHQQALEVYGPPSVLINASYQILHVSERAGRYLLQPRGPLTGNLLRLVRPELQEELHTALLQAFGQNKSVVTFPIYVQFNGTQCRVTLSVRPHAQQVSDGEWEPSSETQPGEALVLFLEDEVARDDPAEADTGQVSEQALVPQLQAELQRLRQRMKATAEQYEASNEELKAVNEELLSVNEEYRSTTEELETSKEELQSLNEELQTVNNELKNKLEEIARIHSDLENLMVATNIAILFLDRDLCIRRYTPALTELFNIMPGDLGRPMDHLTHKLRYDSLENDARQVLKTLMPLEREIRGSDDQWFLTRLRPYRTLDDRIDGVVITFVDTTELKEAEETLRRNEERLRKILQINTVGVIYFDESGAIVDANDTFLRQIGYTRGDIGGTELSWQKLTAPEWMDESYEQMEKLEKTGLISPYEAEYYHKDGSRRWFLFAGAKLDDGTIVEYCIDINQQKEAEEALRAAQAYNEYIVDTVREGLLVLRPDLTVDSANESFYRMFGANEQGTVGRLVYELDDGQWNIPTLRQLLEEVLPKNLSISNYEVELNFTTLGYRTMLLNARQLDPLPLILLAVEDITERRRATEALKALNQTLEERVERRTEEVRQLARQLSLAEQEERNRIARVLHDNLQQSLYGVLLHLSFLRDAHPGEDAEAFRQELATMESAVGEALQITRTLSVELSPPLLHDEGLREAIRWLANEMQEQFGLQVGIEARDSPMVSDEGLRVLLFQTVRELLFNVIKHAATVQATVVLESVNQQIRISVHDDGQGFEKETVLVSSKGGSGLESIRHRLKLVGGEMEVETAPGAGTKIHVVAPLTIGSR